MAVVIIPFQINFRINSRIIYNFRVKIEAKLKYTNSVENVK